MERQALGAPGLQRCPTHMRLLYLPLPHHPCAAQPDVSNERLAQLCTELETSGASRFNGALRVLGRWIGVQANPAPLAAHPPSAFLPLASSQACASRTMRLCRRWTTPKPL